MLKRGKLILIYVVFLTVVINGYSFANAAIFRDYVQRQINADTDLKTGLKYMSTMEQKNKIQYFYLTNLSSSGSYLFDKKKLSSSAEVRFYVNIYDPKKIIQAKIGKNEVDEYKLNLTNRTKSIIMENINRYLNFVTYKEMALDYKKYLKLSLSSNPEDIFTFNELKIMEEQNALFLISVASDEFEAIYSSIGKEIFTDELYENFRKPDFLQRLLERNSDLAKLGIEESTNLLEQKQNAIAPDIDLDGSYKYSFLKEHEVGVHLSMNMQFPVIKDLFNLNMTLDKDKVTYQISPMGKVKAPEKPDFTQQRKLAENYVSNQYGYYLQTLNIVKKKINLSKDKLKFYEQNLGKQISYLEKYLNEKLVLSGYYREMYSYYIEILAMGDVEIFLNSLR